MAFENATFAQWQWTTEPNTRVALNSSHLGIYAPEKLIRDPGYFNPAHHPSKATGSEELVQKLSALYGVASEDVLITLGTAGANFLALSAVCQGGELVAIEAPGYQNLSLAASAAHLETIYFDRPASTGFRPDLNSIRQCLERGAKAVLLTDLHNPSGAALGDDDFFEIKALCEAHDAWLIIDEVYRDFIFLDNPNSRRAHGGRVICTSSFGKVYGLSYVRLGWMLAPEHIVKCAWNLQEAACGPVPTVVQAMGVLALNNRDDIVAWVRSRVEPALALVKRFHSVEKRLQLHVPPGGAVCFPRLPESVDPELFVKTLLSRYGVRVVPGHFFGAPQSMRVGLGQDVDILRQGLGKLSRLLDDMGHK